MYSLRCYTIGMLLALCPFVVIAENEETKTGRLPDGRAFRVDNEGNEIVDYIAELELEKDGLERRVHGLEYELEQKLAEIKRLRHGETEPRLFERDLAAKNTGSKPEQNTNSCSVEFCRDMFDDEFARLDAARKVAADQSAQAVAQQDGTIRDLRAALAAKGAETEALKASLSSARAATSSDPAVSVLRASLSESESQIAALKASLSTRASQAEGDRAALEKAQAESIALKQKMAEMRRETQGSEAQDTAQCERDSLVLKQRLAQLEGELVRNREETRLARANLGAIDREVSTSAVAQSPLSQNRKQALEVLRTRVSTRVTSVNSQLSRRESLYAQFKRERQSITVTLRSPTSARGLTIREVAGRLRAVTSIVELSTLNRDVSEIDQRVREDIQLLERMLRSRR